jgi:tripartite-type tricarboxylate transporter receptor subunit TctC
MKLVRRQLVSVIGAAAAAGAFALVTGPANAETDFPNRPIRMIVPYPAGGIVDIVTRIVTDATGQHFRG